MAIKKTKKESSSNTEGMDDSSFLLSVISDLNENGAISWHDNFALFSTGLTVLDLASAGFIDADSNELNSGVATGRIIQVVAPTGVGKSSLAIQMGAGIISPFPLGQMFIYDGEKSNRTERIEALSGLKASSGRVKLIDKNTNLENLLEFVNALREKKLANEERLTVEVPYRGRNVKVLTPSVIVIDSVASLTKADLTSGSEVGSNMENAQNAIYNNKLVKNIVDKLVEANIFIIAINHITKIVNTGIAPLPRNKINGLKPDENIPGGGAWAYFSDFFIKITVEKIMDKEKDGLDGKKAVAQIIKSRTGANRHIPMYFSSELGGRWIDEYGILFRMVEEGWIGTSGSYLSLEHGSFSKKFYNKNLLKHLEDKDFFDAFYSLFEEKLFETLPVVKAGEELSVKESAPEEE